MFRFRQRNAPDEKLLAENERLKAEARIKAAAQVQLVETVRALSLEVCEGRIELRDTRRALDSFMAADFDGPHNPTI